MLARMWRKGTLFHCGWTCKLIQTLWRSVEILKKKQKLEIKLSYSLATPLLRMYLGKTRILKTHGPLCLLQHYLQQPGHGNNIMSIDRWMDKEVVVHIFNGVLLSHKNYKLESVLARWMNLEPVIQSEVSQKENDKYRILTHTYGI